MYPVRTRFSHSRSTTDQINGDRPDQARTRTREDSTYRKSPRIQSMNTTETTFADLGVPEALLRVLNNDDKTVAFPIQRDTLPDSLVGRDILGRGRTGSGKTLAFVIPLVARLALDPTTLPSDQAGSHESNQPRSRKTLPHPRGLILVPTRELANQIEEVLVPLAKAYHLRTCTVYGGVKQGHQVDALKRGAQIVVACPGRLEDLLRQGLLSLESVSITVLDEADEMADMGFLPAVERLLLQVRPDGQRMLFSATLDHGVDALVKRFLNNARVHEIDSATQHVDQMTHHIFETSQDAKHDLVRRLASGQGKRILFTRTKFQAKKLAKNLISAGIPAAQLHGNLSQNQRDRNLEAFSEGDVRVLVATDVAARGVDISDVELVVQVDPPADSKSFLHRSGRTARAGKSGDVVTVVMPNQRHDARRMLRLAHIDTKPIPVKATSPEVDELVGPEAPRIQGWSLEQSSHDNSRPSSSREHGQGRRDSRKHARQGKSMRTASSGRRRGGSLASTRSESDEQYSWKGSRGEGRQGFRNEDEPFDGRSHHSHSSHSPGKKDRGQFGQSGRTRGGRGKNLDRLTGSGGSHHKRGKSRHSSNPFRSTRGR